MDSKNGGNASCRHPPFFLFSGPTPQSSSISLMWPLANDCGSGDQEEEIIFLTFPMANPKGVASKMRGLALGMENNFYLFSSHFSDPTHTFIRLLLISLLCVGINKVKEEKRSRTWSISLFPS